MKNRYLILFIFPIFISQLLLFTSCLKNEEDSLYNMEIESPYLKKWVLSEIRSTADLDAKSPSHSEMSKYELVINKDSTFECRTAGMSESLNGKIKIDISKRYIRFTFINEPVAIQTMDLYYLHLLKGVTSYKVTHAELELYINDKYVLLYKNINILKSNSD